MTQKLTEDDVESLALSLLKSRGRLGATQNEIQQVIDWAVQARTDQALLNLTLSGELLVAINDGLIVFTKP